MSKTRYRAIKITLMVPRWQEARWPSSHAQPVKMLIDADISLDDLHPSPTNEGDPLSLHNLPRTPDPACDLIECALAP